MNSPVMAQQSPDWNLLAELDLMKLSHSKQFLPDRIAEAIQGMKIEPVQLQRINEVMRQMLYRTKLNAQTSGQQPIVRIRIWSSVQQANRGGWGFFLVERPGTECSQARNRITKIVDLFLYQERCS